MTNEAFIEINDSVVGEIGNPETLEEWHKSLLLPEAYHVERIEKENLRPTCKVYVTHEDILPSFNGSISEIHPYYSMNEGKPEINHIDLWVWNKENKILSIDMDVLHHLRVKGLVP